VNLGILLSNFFTLESAYLLASTTNFSITSPLTVRISLFKTLKDLEDQEYLVLGVLNPFFDILHIIQRDGVE